MKFKKNGVIKKSQRPLSSTIMYIAAAVLALIAIASLVNDIILYRDAVSQYVSQGYPRNLVVKQLLPNQLLPGIFDSVTAYGGIAFVLFCAGLINRKVTECLKLLSKDEEIRSVTSANDVAANSQNVDNSETVNNVENK